MEVDIRSPVTRPRFDVFSPPMLLAAVYVVQFGWAVVDYSIAKGSGAYRVGDLFTFFYGPSSAALAYVWLGYGLFVAGYVTPIGRWFFSRRRLREEPVIVDVRRATIAALGLFLVGLAANIYIASRYSFSRIPEFASNESLDPSLSYLYVVGDLILLAYCLILWLKLAPGATHRFTLVFWSITVTVIATVVVWSSRSKLGYVALASILAYHYGRKQLSVRAACVWGSLILFVAMPALSLLRAHDDEEVPVASLGSYLTWMNDSVMRRTTGLQGFTVAYERRDDAPQPDPVELVVLGVIPRVVWPSKPFADYTERFSLWAAGSPEATLTPSLPGELLLQFGYVGGLAAMGLLGFAWRVLFDWLVGSDGRPRVTGFVYVLILPISLQVLEGGFVVGYGQILRYIVLGVLAAKFICLAAASGRRDSVQRAPTVARAPS